MRLSILCLLAAATLAHADEVQIGEINYGGTGCPNGSVHASVSPDGSVLSLLLDSFHAVADGKKKLERKACNLAVPIHVPAGYSVALGNLQLHGYIDVPSRAKAQLSVESFFPGKRGKVITKTFAPSFSEYELSTNLAPEELAWSACGKDTILRVSASLLVQTNRRGTDTVATVDEALIHELLVRRCN